MDDNKSPAQEMRDVLIDLLKQADGYDDVAAIDEDVTSPTIGFYNEELGHEFFLTVEPA